MEGFRIRRGGVEVAVPDVAGLIRLARAGELARTDEVRTVTGWVRVDEVAELAALVRNDPWAAWENVDEVDAAALYRRMVEVVGDPEELPAEALAPVPEPKAKRPATPPPAGPPSVEIEPLEPELDDGGEVIDFPRPEKKRPPTEVRPRPARPDKRAAAEPAVRTSRVLAWVVAGLLVLGVGWSWLNFAGTPPAAKAPSAAPRSEAPPPSVADGLIKLDAELHRLLPREPRVVKEPGDLADALMVELVQLGVSVASVDAPVTKWVGRRLDEPKTAEVRVAFHTSGDLTRDISAIAIVIGRYKSLYKLDVPVVEITEQSQNRTMSFDAAAAEALYKGRIPLGKFLAELPKQG
ncbi:MAG: hypothetical protein ACOZNI_00445 [Myxococcota bacterium]